MASYDRLRAGGSPRPLETGATWWYAAVAGEAAGSFSTRVRIRTRRACLGTVLLLTVVYAGLVLTATGRRWGDAALTGRRADTAAATLLREHPSLSGLTTLSLVLGCVLLLAVGLLRDPAFDALLTGDSPFEELPALMPRLADGTLPAICHTISYRPTD